MKHLNYTKINYSHLTILRQYSILLLIFVIYIINIKTNGLTLLPREINYWILQKNPDFSFLSFEPLLPLIIAFTGNLCGNSEFCIRLPSPILHFCSALLVFIISRNLYNKKIAILSAITYFTIPAIIFSSSIIDQYCILLFLWLASLYFLINALKSDKFIWWGVLGISLGLGLIANIVTLAFFVSALLVIICDKDYRRHFTSIKPYFASAISLLFYLPNFLANKEQIFFNIQQALNLTAIDLSNFSKFFLSQFVYFGPIVFFMLCYLLIKSLFGFKISYISSAHKADISTEIAADSKNTTPKINANKSDRLLLLFILPLFIFAFIASILRNHDFNFLALTYGVTSILLSAFLFRNNKLLLLKIVLILQFSALIIFISFPFIVKYGHIKLSANSYDIKLHKIADPFYEFNKWLDFSGAIKVILESNPDALMLTDDDDIYSELAYYFAPEGLGTIKWSDSKNDISLIKIHNLLKGKDFIFVTKREDLSEIAKYFESYEKLGNINLSPYSDKNEDIYIYKLLNYLAK